MKTMMSERRNRNVPANSPTRRHVLAGVAMTFGCLALGLTKVRAATGEEISRTAESYRLSQRQRGTPRGGMENTLLGAAREISGLDQVAQFPISESFGGG